MLMFTRTHARLAASDAKKIGEQAKLIEKLTTQNRELKTRNVDLWATKDDAVERAQKVFAANLKLAAECDALRKRNRLLEGCFEVSKINEASMIDTIENLRARLTPFTAPRTRGAGGKFVSTKGAQA
jgi:hypothetical protein